MISVNDFVQITHNAIARFTEANVKEGTKVPEFNISLVSYDTIGDIIKGRFYTSINDSMMYEAIFSNNSLHLFPYKEFKPVVFNISTENKEEEKIDIKDNEPTKEVSEPVDEVVDRPEESVEE